MDLTKGVREVWFRNIGFTQEGKAPPCRDWKMAFEGLWGNRCWSSWLSFALLENIEFTKGIREFLIGNLDFTKGSREFLFENIDFTNKQIN